MSTVNLKVLEVPKTTLLDLCFVLRMEKFRHIGRFELNLDKSAEHPCRGWPL